MTVKFQGLAGYALLGDISETIRLERVFPRLFRSGYNSSTSRIPPSWSNNSSGVHSTPCRCNSPYSRLLSSKASTQQ